MKANSSMVSDKVKVSSPTQMTKEPLKVSGFKTSVMVSTLTHQSEVLGRFAGIKKDEEFSENIFEM